MGHPVEINQIVFVFLTNESTQVRLLWYHTTMVPNGLFVLPHCWCFLLIWTTYHRDYGLFSADAAAIFFGSVSSSYIHYHIKGWPIPIQPNLTIPNPAKPKLTLQMGHNIVVVESEVTAKFTCLLWPRHIKAWNEISAFTRSNYFYSRIFNSQTHN